MARADRAGGYVLMFDIVMPLFNKESFVSRTIESVLGQTYPDWRLFVVDDGSTDRSAAAVEQFDDRRITLLRQANAGPGAARNTGISAGSADWIAFLDADDLWLSTHLEELDRLRGHFPDASLIGTAFVHWTGEGQVPALPQGAGTMKLVRYFREVARGRAPFYTSSAAFSRRAVDEVGPLKPVVVGDETELWARLALHGPVAASTTPTVLYRVGTGGITDSNVEVDRSTPCTLRREDVSLPIATLMSRLGQITNPTLRRDVTDYVDYELGVALLKAVREGRIGYARKLLELFLDRPRGKARIAAMLARLPAPIGQRLLLAIFGAKRVLRSLS